MTGRRTPRAMATLAGLTAVGLVAGLAGCSSAPAIPSPSTAAPQTSPMPTRPAVLPLDRAENDPCGLLTAAQVSQLGAYPGTRSPMAGEPDSYLCIWVRKPVTIMVTADGSWGASADLHHDAASYLSGGAHVVQVGGFGAVQTIASFGDPESNCQLFLDVSPGQSLEVHYTTMRGRPVMNHQLACQLASQAAEQMLANLRATAGTTSGTR